MRIPAWDKRSNHHHIMTPTCRHWSRCTYQIIRVEVTVHADVGTAGSQIPNHTPRTRPEVLERILRIDPALNRVTLHAMLQG